MFGIGRVEAQIPHGFLYSIQKILQKKKHFKVVLHLERLFLNSLFSLLVLVFVFICPHNNTYHLVFRSSQPSQKTYHFVFVLCVVFIKMDTATVQVSQYFLTMTFLFQLLSIFILTISFGKVFFYFVEKKKKIA